MTDIPGKGRKWMKGQSSMLQLGTDKRPWWSEHLVQNPEAKQDSNRDSEEVAVQAEYRH